MSIKLKITLLFIVFSLTILLLFSSFILLRSYLLIYGTIDNNLETLSTEIAKSILNKKNLPEDIEILGNKYWIKIYSQNRKLIYQSWLAKHLSPIPFYFPSKYKKYIIKRYEIKVDKKKFRYLNPDKRREVEFRILSKKFKKGFIQIAYPMEATEEAFQNLLGIVAWAIPVFIIIIALLGYYFSYKTLSPLKDIIAKANYISEKSLNIRLPVKTRDELGKLSTTLNKLFERLEKAFKKQRDFTANVSHELKTPLAMIKISLENILADETLSENQHDTLKNIVSNIQRLQNLISKLLLLSKIDFMIDNPERAKQFNKINILAILEEVIDEFSYYFQSKNINFIKNISKHDIFINGDRELVEKLFFNLFLNAYNFTPKNGTIEIFLNKQFFKIKNSGKGISKEKLSLIFERFYREDESRSRDTGSTGLGLAICKAIAELHAWKITCNSEPDKFTEFQIIFKIS